MRIHILWMLVFAAIVVYGVSWLNAQAMRKLPGKELEALRALLKE